MDDTLELPTAISQPADSVEREEDEQSSGDEDQGPDWTKLPLGSASRPVIPKRGEKEFEPIAAGGSGLQRHVLDRARNAMVDALSASRTISSKSISYAVWYPDISRAHVTLSRGIHFANMGHSVARAPQNEDGVAKVQKRLELLPEEALYLVERGAMLCWRAYDTPVTMAPGLEDVEGIPMTVQQAFAEMIGTEDLTLEKYQVFAYLKRLGYVVTRAKPPSRDYPMPPPLDAKNQRSSSLISKLYVAMQYLLRPFVRIFSGGFDWWRPLRFNRWLYHNWNSRTVFKSLRFLPGGHQAPLRLKAPLNSPSSPYEIFFNLYKPSTPFKKTAPPAPDYSVVVVNARTTSMPSLSELTTLFEILPELPPPVPRKRLSFAQQKMAATPAPSSAPTTRESEPSLLQKIFPWAFLPPSKPGLQRNPNPFLALKTGKKMVVVAAVDAGTISFFRFGQGVFAEWPML